MKNWFFWAGISFIIGGIVSWAITNGTTENVSFQEDVSGYSFGWIIVGVMLVIIGLIKKRK